MARAAAPLQLLILASVTMIAVSIKLRVPDLPMESTQLGLADGNLSKQRRFGNTHEFGRNPSEDTKFSRLTAILSKLWLDASQQQNDRESPGSGRSKRAEHRSRSSVRATGMLVLTPSNDLGFPESGDLLSTDNIGDELPNEIVKSAGVSNEHVSDRQEQTEEMERNISKHSVGNNSEGSDKLLNTTYDSQEEDSGRHYTQKIDQTILPSDRNLTGNERIFLHVDEGNQTKITYNEATFSYTEYFTVESEHKGESSEKTEQSDKSVTESVARRPRCRQSSGIINCSKMGVEVFYPNDRVAYVDKLILSFNRIRNLTKQTFSGLTLLQKLFVDHNEVSFVAEDAFSELAGLRVLDLSFNRIRQLAPTSFSLNPQLFILNLSSNPLASQGLGSWLRSESLGVLFLNSCNASALPEDAFASVTELLYLHLCGNGLQQLPAQLFRQLTDLRHLYLDHNELAALPPDIFEDNPQLEWLFLRHNRVSLSEHAAFLNASSLLMLDLEDNNVSAVGERTFAGLHGLHNLTLRKNGVRRWSGVRGGALPRLRYLDLSWNRLPLRGLAPFPHHPRLACANLGGNPAACDPAVAAPAFCADGCSVATPAGARAAPSGNCTRRLLVKFFSGWRPSPPALLAAGAAGAGGVGGAPEEEREEAAVGARLEAAATAAYAWAAATILACLATTAALGAFLGVRNRRRARRHERLLAAYSRSRSARPRLDKLEAVSRAADCLEAADLSLPPRTATVGRSGTLSRAAAAAALVAAETPLLRDADAASDAASRASGYYDISCWLPERRRPPSIAGRKLF